MKTKKKQQWVDILNGKLTLRGFPGKATLKSMEISGCTCIISIVKDTQYKKLIDILKEKKIESIHIPLKQAHPERIMTEMEQIIYTSFLKLKIMLNNGGRVMIHCSAGIHRTGMYSYAFLLYLGYSEEDALKTISQMRVITGKQVGDHRLLWSKQFYGRIKQGLYKEDV